MLNDAYYAFCLDDPAVPAFCSFSKLYFGTEADLLEVAGNLEKYGNYPETAAGIRSYFAGNTGVTHVIAYKEIPVIQPAEVLDSSKMQIGPYQWTHMNTWDCPYGLRFDSAIISQLLLRYDGKVLRCIRARFNGLAYLAYADRWNPIGGTIFVIPLCCPSGPNRREATTSARSSICARTAPHPLWNCGIKCMIPTP